MGKGDVSEEELKDMAGKEVVILFLMMKDKRKSWVYDITIDNSCDNNMIQNYVVQSFFDRSN